MTLHNLIKNKFSKIKESLKSAIFSKNQNLTKISEFNKKTTFNKIMTITTVNMFMIVPYLFLFSFTGHFFSWISVTIPSFFLSLFICNSLFFGSLKIFSVLSSFSRNKEHKEAPLIIHWNDSLPQQVNPVYFSHGFMEKLKEFFVATASVSISFIPLFLFLNIVFLFIYFIDTSLFDISLFSTFYYLKLDIILLFLFTTLTLSGIYTLRALNILFSNSKSIMNYLFAKKNQHTEEPQKPVQKIFITEEFIPSLNKEFSESHRHK